MTADGGRRLVSWSNRLLVDATGEPLCLVTSGLDLTGRVRQREEDARALEDDPELRLAQVGRLAQEQRALRRVATLVASEVSPEQVFMVVSEESARVLDVDACAVMRYDARRQGRGHGTPPPRRHRHVPPRRALPARQRELAGPRAAHRRPRAVDDWGAHSGAMARRMARVGYRSTASAPIVVAGQLWGAVAIGSSDTLPPQSEARLGAFCELASLAVASAQAREDLHASRARVVKAGDEQRRRLERNLHDGAQQRLVSVALMLRIARQQLAAGRDGALRCSSRRRTSSTRAWRSCASSRAACTRALWPSTACCTRSRRCSGGWRCELDVERRAPAREPRGDRVLHRGRGADERHAARRRDAGAGDRGARGRRRAGRDRRRRRGRRRRDARHPG